VDFVLQASEALAEAHAVGIVHRDLKPANLFLARRANGSELIKVLDFGISKTRTDDEASVSLTTTQTVMGSPLYMSPEQLRASRDVDARTDIWSLGVVLFQLLTGRLPFSGTSATAVAACIAADPPAPLREIRSDVPETLERIVLRCLQKPMADRFSSVVELCAALAPLGDHPNLEDAVQRAASAVRSSSGSRMGLGEATPAPGRKTQTLAPDEGDVASSSKGGKPPSAQVVSDRSSTEAAGAASRSLRPPAPVRKLRVVLGGVALSGLAVVATVWMVGTAKDPSRTSATANPVASPAPPPLASAEPSKAAVIDQAASVESTKLPAIGLDAGTRRAPPPKSVVHSPAVSSTGRRNPLDVDIK
jgi:serine/threonine-protein kinase